MSSANEPMNRWVARFFLLVGAGLAVALALYLTFVMKFDVRWVGVVGVSLVLFGLLIHEFKDYWRDGRYWAIVLASLAAHFAMLYTVRTHLHDFPLAIVGAFATLEAGVVAWLIITVCQ
jgi:hypothetical protein